MTSCLWWDRKPVYYLCTGSVMTSSTIERKIKRIRVGCPQLVNDYQNWMGGVDRHDPLRLQNYSLQMSTRFTNQLFLTHKEAAKIKGTVAMKRSDWFTALQNQLLQLKAENFAGIQVTAPSSRQKRWRTPKRRQRSCKVCALLRIEKRKSFATTYFCERCSVDNAKCWLCNKIRREYKGVAKTCFEIWHDDFGAGQDIPAHLGKRVVLRRPGKNTENCKKTRRELQLLREEGRDGDDADNDSNDE
ncbi:hypothetical protein L916_00477 [Phytophthora nicotianae]|uniref:PiggyBac transposable element-derived protein domain-containing protein n=1 Tax=Phytophthora nicotianae TaxID=4792 RepID=W2JV25_PHYNI|nr:hypothetical protein L916_00477 [Phytophthora nicotianae]